MIIESGKHVRCVFKNGTIIEGIVKEWANGHTQIESLTDQSLIIIVHPEEDIMLIKILPEAPTEQSNNSESGLHLGIVDKLEEIRQEEDPELRKKNLEELRKMVVAQERQIIANKIREHRPSAYRPHKPNYGSQISLLPSHKRNR